MLTPNYNIPMNLAVSASRRNGARRDDGYAMAALLVAISVMAVLLTVAMPTWKQTIQREKEEELIFRGNQYARAIAAYQRTYANASPPSLDVLVEQHFLRKKFKDPVAIDEDGEFQLLYATTQAGQTGGTGTAPNGGGIIGVASKNPAPSIRVYNNATHYNEWQFIPQQQSLQGGQGGESGQAGQPGQPGGQRGQGSGPGGRRGQGPQPGRGRGQ